MQRKTPGPIRDRGQKETGHDRGDVTKKKFMRVPGNHAIAAGEGPPTGQQSDPQHHSDKGPQGSAEEERPEAVTQQWDCLRPEPRNAALLGTAAFAHDYELGSRKT